jgi:hypothetical protein
VAHYIHAERLMPVIYAYGTNCGTHSMISDVHDHSEEDLRYVRRRYLTPEYWPADVRYEKVGAGGGQGPNHAGRRSSAASPPAG